MRFSWYHLDEIKTGIIFSLGILLSAKKASISLGFYVLVITWKEE